MQDANKMLTQEEIDSMVSKGVNKSAPPHKPVAASVPAAKTAPAPPPPPPAPPPPSHINVQKVSAIPAEPKSVSGSISHGKHEDCIAAGDINSLHERVAELSNRIARIELMVSKLDGNSNQAASGSTQAALKAAVQQIQNVSSQVEVITEGLRGTAGYNINKVFNCSGCGSVGVVAVKVKCTKCGQENWWGWWPKKK
jgi:hypothetical protein